jgi:hypothetical protein
MGQKLGMTIRVWVPDTHRVSDLMGTGTIFYLWVAPIPDLN